MGGCRDYKNIDKWVYFEDLVAYVRWVRSVFGDDAINGMPKIDISLDGIEKVREASSVADKWDSEDHQGRLEEDQRERREKESEIERNLGIVRARKNCEK